MVRQIAAIELKLMKRNMSYLKRAKLGIEKESIEKDLFEYGQKNIKTLNKQLIDNLVNFDELCLGLSRLDGKMSFKEIAALSVYEFYRLKTWLEKIHKPKSQRTNSDEE